MYFEGLSLYRKKFLEERELPFNSQRKSNQLFENVKYVFAIEKRWC